MVVSFMATLLTGLPIMVSLGRLFGTLNSFLGHLRTVLGETNTLVLGIGAPLTAGVGVAAIRAHGAYKRHSAVSVKRAEELAHVFTKAIDRYEMRVRVHTEDFQNSVQATTWLVHQWANGDRLKVRRVVSALFRADAERESRKFVSRVMDGLTKKEKAVLMADKSSSEAWEKAASARPAGREYIVKATILRQLIPPYVGHKLTSSNAVSYAVKQELSLVQLLGNLVDPQNYKIIENYDPGYDDKLENILVGEDARLHEKRNSLVNAIMMLTPAMKYHQANA